MTAELDNYVDFLKQIERQAREVLEGLPADALNWRPLPDAAGADSHATNSLAVVVAHLAGSVRYWVGEVAGGRPAHRDRDAEFRVQAADVSELIQRVTEAAEYSQAVLAKLPAEHLDEMVERNGKPISRRHAIVHALTHASVHLGHMEITRQLWEASRR
ncbi:MAG: DinB family protein [Anaerolineales bacterium]